MRTTAALLLGSCLLWLAGTVGVARGSIPAVGVVNDDIAVVVHRAFDAGAQIDAPRLQAIFNSSEGGASSGKPIIAFNYPPTDKLRVEFDRVVLHMSPAEASRYWTDQRIQGGHRAPRQVGDPLLVLRLVGKLPGSIGYLPSRLVDGTVRIVARIHDGQLVAP